MIKAQDAPMVAPVKLKIVPKKGPNSAPPAKVKTMVGKKATVARQYNNKKITGAMKPSPLIQCMTCAVLFWKCMAQKIKAATADAMSKRLMRVSEYSAYSTFYDSFFFESRPRIVNKTLIYRLYTDHYFHDRE